MWPLSRTWPWLVFTMVLYSTSQMHTLELMHLHFIAMSCWKISWRHNVDAGHATGTMRKLSIVKPQKHIVIFLSNMAASTSLTVISCCFVWFHSKTCIWLLCFNVSKQWLCRHCLVLVLLPSAYFQQFTPHGPAAVTGAELIHVDVPCENYWISLIYNDVHFTPHERPLLI